MELRVVVKIVNVLAALAIVFVAIYRLVKSDTGDVSEAVTSLYFV